MNYARISAESTPKMLQPTRRNDGLSADTVSSAKDHFRSPSNYIPDKKSVSKKKPWNLPVYYVNLLQMYTKLSGLIIHKPSFAVPNFMHCILKMRRQLIAETLYRCLFLYWHNLKLEALNAWYENLESWNVKSKPGKNWWT